MTSTAKDYWLYSTVKTAFKDTIKAGGTKTYTIQATGAYSPTVDALETGGNFGIEGQVLSLTPWSVSEDRTQWLDGSGNGNNATNYGAIYGTELSGLEMTDAENQRIVIPAFSSISTKFTFEFDVKCLTSKNNGFIHTLYRRGSQSGSVPYLWLYYDTPREEICIQGVNLSQTGYIIRKIHIADVKDNYNKLSIIIDYENYNVKLYADGQFIGSSAYEVINPFSSSTSASLGNYDNKLIHNLNGTFYGFKMYEDELSIDEITHNANYKNNPIMDNLKVWYKFDDGSGRTVTDYSGNEINGTIATVSGETWVKEHCEEVFYDDVIPSLKFNGTDTYMAMSGSSSLLFTNEQSIHYNLKNHGDHMNGIGGIWLDNSSTIRNRILINSSNLNYAQYLLDGVEINYFGPSVGLNIWKDSWFLFGDNEFAFEVDGVMSTPLSISGTMADYTSYGKYIGKGHVSNYYYNGLLSSLNIFNKKLNEDERLAIQEYRKYAPNLVISSFTDLGSGLYQFTVENTGATDYTDVQIPLDVTALGLTSTSDSVEILNVTPIVIDFDTNPLYVNYNEPVTLNATITSDHPISKIEVYQNGVLKGEMTQV